MNAMRLTALTVSLAFFAVSVNAQDAESSEEDDFKHFSLTNYGQVGAGYVVLEKAGDGIVTVNLEIGFQLRYYFATQDEVLGGKRTRDVSVFLRSGVGPLLVDEGLVPIFCTINPGFSYNYLDTNVSYGLLAVVNFNGVHGPGYLYGFSASFDD